MKNQPPLLARLLMWLTLPASEREFFLGDIEEEFQQRLRVHGPRHAQQWYWKQTLRAPWWWHRTSPDFTTDHAEARKGEIMLSLVQDTRYAYRSLMKSPSLVALAVAALTLGIGANTAVFSVVNAILLKPLPYADPDRLVRLWESPPPSYPTISVAPVNLREWEKQNTVFASLGAYREEGYSLSDDGMPERVLGARITASLQRTLGVVPEIGRWFTPEEDVPGLDGVVLLGHDLWQRRFGSDPRIIGNDVRIDGVPRTVIGVMPRGFHVPIEESELWIPYALDDAKVAVTGNTLRVLGRLKPGATIETARVEFNRIAARIEEERPKAVKGWRVAISRMDESITGQVSRPLWAMLGCVGLVLLIACANVANLLLARSVSRRKEIALRFSLGASRGRLVSQLLCESVMLSLVGGVSGIAIAAGGLRLLKAAAPGNIPRLAGVALEPQLLAFTLLLSIAAGLLFGVIPALRGSRVDLSESLKTASHGTMTGRRDHRAGALLVVAQVTIAMVIVISSGLMLRTLWNLSAVNPGFQTEERLTFHVALNSRKYAVPQARMKFISDTLERVRNLPGVRNVAATHRLPMTGNSGFGGVRFEGKPDPQTGQSNIVIYRSITPEYFNVMGIPLLRGRTFDRREAEESGDVVVVNQRMAATFWPGEDALGKRLQPAPNMPWLTVVGIATDSKEIALAAEGAIGMYMPYVATPGSASEMNVIVHVNADINQLAGMIRQEIRQLDPDMATTAIRPMDDVVADTVSSRSFTAALLTIFAGIALLLSAAGIYGVLAYAVNQRQREIGVRMALGASRRVVLSRVIVEGLRLIVPGVVFGTVGALAATRLLSSMLFGVTAADPVTFFFIAVFVVLIGALACYIPARRAASVDPLVALRNE